MSVAAVTMSAATVGARIIVMDGYGMSSIEGVIVEGDRAENGVWDLDGRFQLIDDGGHRFWVNGWCCEIELNDADEGQEGMAGG